MTGFGWAAGATANPGSGFAWLISAIPPCRCAYRIRTSFVLLVLHELHGKTAGRFSKAQTNTGFCGPAGAFTDVVVVVVSARIDLLRRHQKPCPGDRAAET